MPARANASASTRVATVSPRAPYASWRRPSSTHLWVLACGRRATPSRRARSAMARRFRSTTSRCKSSAGVSRSYISPLLLPLPSARDVKGDLPAQDPPHLPVRAELGILFLGGADRLAPPLRNGRRRLQLDREPAARDERHIAAARDAFLVVPQADQRAGGVSAVADGMRVDRAVDARRPHRRERGREHLVAGAPRPHLGE